MTPLENVRREVIARCGMLPVASVARADAFGSVLAEDVVSGENVPPFDNTAVDGYAVRAADTVAVPCELRVAGELSAGSAPTVRVESGTAVRIMTGAPIPEGSDAVVMVEETERLGGERVRILSTVSPGDAIRRAGSDVRKGDTVFVAGTVVTPAVEGVLATVNARHVTVRKRARVGVLSTGDELVDDGAELRPGEIRESNRTMLLRLVGECGAEAVDLGIVRDDERLLADAIRDAADVRGCDALVTSGGVSMGDYDVVKAVLSRIADMSWVQIAMKPAKPFAFGTIARSGSAPMPVFGLPGNPVSSLVSFELLARPALRTMMGFGAHSHRPIVRGVLDEAVARRADGKVHFDRATAVWGDDGRVHVRRVAAQGSHQLAATAVANALLVVPDGDGLRAGSDVGVVLLGPDAGPV